MAGMPEAMRRRRQALGASRRSRSGRPVRGSVLRPARTRVSGECKSPQLHFYATTASGHETRNSRGPLDVAKMGTRSAEGQTGLDLAKKPFQRDASATSKIKGVDSLPWVAALDLAIEWRTACRPFLSTASASLMPRVMRVCA